MIKGWSWLTGGPATSSFKTIQTPSGTSPVAVSPTDTLTLAAGAGITITGNSATDTVTIASTALVLTTQAITSNTNAASGTTYLCDTSGGAFTLTLPSHSSGQTVAVKDSGFAFNTNNLTIARNGGTANIEGQASNYTCYINAMYLFLYDNGTDWIILT